MTPAIATAIACLQASGLSEADILSRLHGGRRSARGERHRALHCEIQEMLEAGARPPDVVVFVQRTYRLSRASAYFHLGIVQKLGIEIGHKATETGIIHPSENSNV